jgi:hypothetical protein
MLTAGIDGHLQDRLSQLTQTLETAQILDLVRSGSVWDHMPNLGTCFGTPMLSGSDEVSAATLHPCRDLLPG